ncbi:DUF4136 domain-containing protein [Tenacibaculum sp. nBUS_03]|uniref:DUF4136 domain-containing protein n=1 Tax=Tenacibaculum sp. nBUS_03 TaxID=3395320 RepID=UPI003EC0F871
MNKLKFFFLFLFISCSSSRVIYDYDTKTDFKRFKTFNFFDDIGKGLNELDIKRISQKIVENLNTKGIKLSENPDFYVNFFSAERESTNRNTIGVGIGGGGNVGFGISGGIPIGRKKINQILTIDFVEATSNELIWQSEINSELSERSSPSEKNTHYSQIIKKSFTNYPPKK